MTYQPVRRRKGEPQQVARIPAVRPKMFVLYKGKRYQVESLQCGMIEGDLELRWTVRLDNGTLVSARDVRVVSPAPAGV